MKTVRRVVVVGLDGFDPALAETLMGQGDLPVLAGMRRDGGYGRLATTYPAQTPVAWSTFATGANPGVHGIFDFVARNPATCWPEFALNRYESRNPFVAPRVVNLRHGRPLWDVLSSAGVHSTVLRCPCTYPPDALRGRMLSGLGVPDIRGGLGTSTFYTSAADAVAGESEVLVRVLVDENAEVATHLVGPRHPRTRDDLKTPVRFRLGPGRDQVSVSLGVQRDPLVLGPGTWSPWLKVRWKAGLLQEVRGMLRFYLRSVRPEFELYASPVNFDPDAPLFPISAPTDYSAELAGTLGPYYTTGMVEDHGGLNNGRFDEYAFLDQCDQVMRERERMLQHELARLDEGFLFCLFDTPDRLQHMMWRFRDPDHPANRVHGHQAELAGAVDDHYRKCDALVSRVVEAAGADTMVIVLSDHGFTTFRRGVNLNTWLHDAGWLALAAGCGPGAEAGELFAHVDWSRTKAYAVGLGGIYLNLGGREARGVVSPEAAPELKSAIASALTGLRDEQDGRVAVRSVLPREAVYRGPRLGDAPDLVVNFSSRYRASWGTALGGVPAGHFEDNVRRWAGDHIVDPELVPGVLFMNRPFRADGARLLDLAPTILAALGVPPDPAMEGRSLLS